ncbi:MAG: hypothetical protein ACYTG2_12810 [Planctomycetota bacterium]|jgi:hypothetical protein
MRLLLPVLCAVVVLWLHPAPIDSVCAPKGMGPDRSVPAETGCKPLAPIDVVLETPDGDGPGAVRVRQEIAPRLDLEALVWHWELSADVRFLEGAQDGAGATGRGVSSEAELVLLVPDDGRRHRADLVVTGRLPMPDEVEEAEENEPELVTAVRSLTWGPVPQPGPIVFTRDAVTGMPTAVVAVPASHVPAPAPAPEER